jgi:hypothetical protein
MTRNTEEIRTFLEQLRWELSGKEYGLTHGTHHLEIQDTIDRLASEGGGLLLPERTVIETPDGISDEQRIEAERQVIEQVSEERRMQLDAVGVILDLIDDEVVPDDEEIVYGVHITDREG